MTAGKVCFPCFSERYHHPDNTVLEPAILITNRFVYRMILYNFSTIITMETAPEKKN